MSFGDVIEMEAQQENMDPGRSWGSVTSEAWENLGPSGKKAAEELVSLVAHPLDTLDGFRHVALGAIEKVIPGRQGDEKYAEAVWDHLVSRYGGVENFKNALAKDPAGVAVDVVTLAAGGAGLGKAAASVGSKAAKLAGTAAKSAGIDLGKISGIMKGAAQSDAAIAAAAAAGKFRACFKRQVETVLLDPANEMQRLTAEKIGVLFKDEATGKMMVRSHEGATELKEGCRIAIDKTADGPVHGYNIKESAVQSRYVKKDSPSGLTYVSNKNQTYAISFDEIEKATGDTKRVIDYMKQNEVAVKAPDGTVSNVKQLSRNADGSWTMVAPWGEKFEVVKGSQMLIDNPAEVAKALKAGEKPPVPDVRPVKGDVFDGTYAYRNARNTGGTIPLNGKDLDVLSAYVDIIAKHPESMEYMRYRGFVDLTQNQILTGERAERALKGIFNITEDELAGQRAAMPAMGM